MAYLMNIRFDNSARLQRNVYYFEYKGIRFKLIQNNIRKWCDILLTIIPGRNNVVEENRAYIAASEFLSALSRENNSLAKLGPAGGRGIPENYQLRKAKCSIWTFPRVPFSGYAVGYDICRIPQVENEEQRDALFLFREGSACNNDYLSFLFFWQIMEIGTGRPIEWINKTYKENRNKIRLPNSQFERLNLNGKRLGKYFHDYRVAIAHIFTLYNNKKDLRLKLDSPAENVKIANSTWVIREFARLYIKGKLELEKSMYLLRKHGKGFPVYVTEEDAKRFPGTIAYKRLSHNEIRKKRWH